MSSAGSPQVISNLSSVEDDSLLVCEASDDCTHPIDIIVRSSDGVRIGTHKSNLFACSKGLVPATSRLDSFGSSSHTNTLQDVVLPEDSEVIQLLLKFTHYQPQPDLRLIGTNLLFRFANAAEKYCVYSATGVCNIVMEMSMKDQPFEVFQYTSTWGYVGLQEAAAKLAMAQCPAKFFAYAHSINRSEWRDLAEQQTHKLTTKEVCDSLREFCKGSEWPEVFGAWFQKRDTLRSALFFPLNNPIPVLHKGGSARCEEWHSFYPQLLGKMAVEVPCEDKFLSTLESLRPILKDCIHCGMVLKSMKERVHHGLESVVKKPLAEFLNH
ncbi:hypothetical protein K435DRAFT_971807 [Dendrothele bispora CBS 962.96]|uniref:BTB domain-containing protein n=1 Tax=Dendrothele bispora (strain CBS 962.96) TaxID=1314807 RepID=A0A4S8L2Y3_DENBC|nr:hypothetical protein K435DRAFT_971807 [Dendrothele bispora CBS 962.96]